MKRRLNKSDTKRQIGDKNRLGLPNGNNVTMSDQSLLKKKYRCNIYSLHPS